MTLEKYCCWEVERAGPRDRMSQASDQELNPAMMLGCRELLWLAAPGPQAASDTRLLTP